MADFEVKITLKDDETVVYTTAAGNPAKAKIIPDQLKQKLIDRFNYWIAKDDHYDRTDLELLGRMLYDILLPKGDPNDSEQQNLRKLFESEYALFHKMNQKDLSGTARFRLTLELHEDARILGKYPWEFLFIPPEEKTLENESPIDLGFFLAGERNKLILTRFVPKVSQELIVKTEEPLRILVIFSHPKELDPITSEATRDVIKSIKDLENLKHIEVREEENPTHFKLYDLMNGDDKPTDVDKKTEDRVRFKPDIVHFIGHGKQGQLALFRNKEDIDTDEENGLGRIEADWCNSKQVLALFANHTPRLVFLHACESASAADSIKGFSDLARDLVYAKIPIVVAMQYTIKNKDAALFAKKFYEEIRNGSLIDEAVRVGREALGQSQDKKKSWADRRFGTPVVYFQTKGQQALINIPRSETTGASLLDVYDPEERVSCPNLMCPSLPNKLTLDSVLCVICEHELMICPQCRDKNHKNRLMSITLGKCSCGYRPDMEQKVAGTSVSSPLKTEQAGVASAGESSRIEQAEVAPADANPKAVRAETQTASAKTATS